MTSVCDDVIPVVTYLGLNCNYGNCLELNIIFAKKSKPNMKLKVKSK